jgi:hypothetical protein
VSEERVLLDATSEAAKELWSGIALEARRRRLAIEVRDGTPDLPYKVIGKERSGADWSGGSFVTLDEAFRVAEAWVVEHPIPGPTALRDELREHGRRLAMMTPRDLGKKGSVGPVYRRFRDRILPLAFDNLVDSHRLESLEDAAREVVKAYEERGHGKERSTNLNLAIATLRGLVEPKAAGDPEGGES